MAITFNDLGLAEPITRALVEERYSDPTPIQAAAIPPALAGRDVVGIAQTGTGKTAAFALPILNRLAAADRRPEPKACRILVLCPTRELGSQIVDSFHTYGRYLRVKSMLAIGGVPIGKQTRALAQGVDILVATPGRLLDLANNRAVHFKNVEVLVLDEADRMLDMGFIRDIRKIVAMVPKERQTLFFSATMAPEIARLADQMLIEPVTVAVTPAATTVELIEQRAIRVDRSGKPRLLADILSRDGVERALVFTRTKHGADKVVRGLVDAGIPAEAIHGNKAQSQRERTMAAFRQGNIRTLVATDIAARGIDVDGISHVINYDLPNIPDTYVHRIGRTARAGASGVAISLVSGDEMPFLRDIEKLIRLQIPLEGGERTGGSGRQVEADRPDHDRAQPRRSGHGRPNHGRPDEHRNTKHADGPSRNKRPRGRNEDRQKHKQPADGNRAHNGNGRNGGKGTNGNGIADVRFMDRPRRPGMAQGSASRPDQR